MLALMLGDLLVLIVALCLQKIDHRSLRRKGRGQLGVSLGLGEYLRYP
jgi:hypothetical protein